MNIAERYTTRISDAELARRWERIRTEMGHNDLDCLIFSAYDNMLGGYFRYVTDLMIADYPMTVLFPKDSDMCLTDMAAYLAPVCPQIFCVALLRLPLPL